MNATRMIEIAISLKRLYEERALHSLNEWQAGKDAEQRAALLTPPEGWPGKNQEQREAAREQALAGDPAYAQCVKDQQAAHRAVVEIEAQIEGLAAERRALEFAVRITLAQALTVQGVNANHRGDPVDNAFDDVQDRVYDDIPF